MHSNESFKPWDCVFQSLKLCVSKPETVCLKAWDYAFHILKLCVPCIETLRSMYWNSAFHVLKPCVPCTETVRSMYWNDEFHRLKQEWNTLITRADAHKEHEKGALVKIELTHPKYIIRYSTSMEQAPLCSVTCCHKRDTTWCCTCQLLHWYYRP